MIRELFNAAQVSEQKYRTAEFEFETSVIALVSNLQKRNQDDCVRFTEESGIPHFHDGCNNEITEFELCKVRNGELYIKDADDDDYNWYCPFEYGTIDFSDILSCLTNLIPDYDEKE